MENRIPNWHMLVLYDASMAKYVQDRVPDEIKPGFILVGDSLSMVVKGFDTTLHANVDDVVRHIGYVRKGLSEKSRIELVGDMPTGSYPDGETALANARRMLAAGANSIKLECTPGRLPEICEIVHYLTQNGVGVMGHIGFLPQTAPIPKIQGSTREEILRMLEEARGLEQAGAFYIMIELVYDEVGKLITDSISVPTVAIAGTGPGCTGQAMNIYDSLSLSELSAHTKIRWLPKPTKAGSLAINEWMELACKGIYPAKGEYHTLEGKTEILEFIKSLQPPKKHKE